MNVTEIFLTVNTQAWKLGNIGSILCKLVEIGNIWQYLALPSKIVILEKITFRKYLKNNSQKNLKNNGQKIFEK